MAVLVAFAAKAYQQAEPARQFQLSSLFLLIVPFAIYSTGIRAILATVPANLGTIGWVGATVGCLAFVVLSTVILLWMADALLWLAVLVARQIRRHM